MTATRFHTALHSSLKLTCGVLLFALTGCSKPPVTTLPAQILGEWQTDDARYRGRGMKLDSNRVIFGLGGAAPDKAELIQDVKMTPPDNPTDFQIRMRTADGVQDSIALQFTPANGGELRIKSQAKIVWRRGNAFSRRVADASEAAQPVVPSPAVVPTPAPTAAPEARPVAERPETQKTKRRAVLVRIDGTQEHLTIYKIDCLHPNDCESY